MDSIDLPSNLISIFKAESFPLQRHRWNTNEEIASILISFEKHEEWLSREVQNRPKSGSMLLYSRKKVRYRRDGYCWKKRKDGKTTREDHMKLKVQGTECIYGCYVHSAILITFHRRCYWLLQNPDIVLVHYLNVPYSDDNKIITPIINISDNKKKWTREDLMAELKPMFFNESEPDVKIDLELSTFETIEEMVQLMMTQHRARVRALEEANEVNLNTRAVKVVSAATSCAKEKDDSCLDLKPDLNKLEIREDSPFLQQPLTLTSNTLNATNSCPNFSQTFASQANVHYLQLTNASNCNLKSISNDKSKEDTSTSFLFNLSSLQNENGLLLLNSTTPNQASVNSDLTESAPLTFIYNRPHLTESKFSSNNTKESLYSTTSFELKPHQTLSQLEFSPLTQTSHAYTTISAFSMIDLINGNCIELQKDTNLIPKKNCDNQTILPKLIAPSSNLASVNQSVISSLDIKRELDSSQTFDQTVNEKESNQDNLNFSSSLVESPSLVLKNQNLSDSVSSDLNPMELIDNDISTQDEDLFSLENFDMLTEFSSLDDLNDGSNRIFTSSPHQQSPGTSIAKQNISINHKSSNLSSVNQSKTIKPQSIAIICDFSPDWCYIEGGTKVLIIGPWYSQNLNYSVLFDGHCVSATLIQSGVLRCVSPPHEAGCVSLYVACEGSIISNSIIFEYKTKSDDNDYFAIDDNILKFSLLERLELLETHLSVNFQNSSTKDNVDRNISSFENKLISNVEELMNASWLPLDDSLTSQSVRKGSSLVDMSLLHLAAALGYHTLVSCLFRWKAENPSILLDMEVDAFSCDKNECTPLMWASARGHKEAACLLYRWRRAAINLCDNQGFSPLHIARKKGYFCIVNEIEKIEMETDENDYTSSTFKFKCNNQTDKSPFYSKKGVYYSKLDSFASGARKSFSLDSTGTEPSINLSLDDDSLLDESCTPSSEETDDSSNIMRFLDGFSNNLNSSCEISHSRSRCSIGESSASDIIHVLTFAEHIIAAMPDRIKAAAEASLSNTVAQEKLENEVETQSVEVDDFIVCDLVPICNEKRDVMDGQSFIKINTNEPFEKSLYGFEQNNYRHSDLPSPTSSLASSCLQSPGSFHNLESPSPPSAEDLCEFFQASGRIMEKEFSDLTLSDREQRELYEAAKVIQKAYRTYKGRKRKEQEKERQAAIIIQNSYRRYKQYKQMTKAAQIIQTQFRNYCEHKRFKKSVKNNYANSKDASYFNATADSDRKKSAAREPMSSNLKRSYSQRRQHQAARKIQQFLRQSKNKLQKERALRTESENKGAEKEVS